MSREIRFICASSVPATLKWPLSRKMQKALKEEKWVKLDGARVSEMPPRSHMNVLVIDGKEYMVVNGAFNFSRSQRDEIEKDKLREIVRKNEAVFPRHAEGSCVVGKLYGNIQSDNCLVVCNPNGSEGNIGRGSNGFVSIFSNNFNVPKFSPGGFIGNSYNIRHNYSSDALVYNCDGVGVDNSDGLVVSGYAESGFDGCEFATYINKTEERKKEVEAKDSGGSIGINVDHIILQNSYGASIVNSSHLGIVNSKRMQATNTSHRNIVNMPEKIFVDGQEIDCDPKTVVEVQDAARNSQALIRETLETAVDVLVHRIAQGRNITFFSTPLAPRHNPRAIGIMVTRCSARSLALPNRPPMSPSMRT